MNETESKQPLTLEAVYARLRECLDAVKLNDKKLSPVVREKLEFNLHFLRCYIELQGESASSVQAVGFQIEEAEFEPIEYGEKPKK